MIHYIKGFLHDNCYYVLLLLLDNILEKSIYLINTSYKNNNDSLANMFVSLSGVTSL